MHTLYSQNIVKILNSIILTALQSSRRHQKTNFNCFMSWKTIQTLYSEHMRHYLYQISDRDNTLYEVKSKETLCEYIVNLAVETCSCHEWQCKVSIPQLLH